MPAEQKINSPTESDLEAAIHAVVRRIFPWLPGTEIQHQTRFSFQIGHKSIEIDGTQQYTTTGIADIILRHEGNGLAVLELKRAGIALTSADEEQGLSYARMLVPPAPLVVVTNGRDTRILATHTGAPWQPSEFEEREFALLVAGAARVASDDIRCAVDSLMGTNPQVWREAMREVTRRTVEELSGDWNDHEHPFVRGFLFPRVATKMVIQGIIKGGQRLVVVEGPPMIGKSNVLREIVARVVDKENFGVLFLEYESGRGVFETMADMLGRALSWPVTADEARTWLKRVSHSSATRVWILIDGFTTSKGQGLRDIEDLSSDSFGKMLAVVVAMDDTIADQIVQGENRRSKSPIGRRAARLAVGRLDVEEFATAKRALESHRISLIKGAELTHEYRQPWMLRAAATASQDELQRVPKPYAMALPPFQGFNLIDITRARFGHPEDRRMFKYLADAFLEEVEDKNRPAQLVVAGCDLFLIRDSVFDTHISDEVRRILISRGLVKEIIFSNQETGLVVRLPELLACELARTVEVRIVARENEPNALAKWLAHVAALMPLGDVIVARALFDRAMNQLGQNDSVVEALRDMPPVRDTIPVGATALISGPDGEQVHLRVTEEGAIATLSNGGEIALSKENGDWSGQTYSDIYPWLILSHLVEWPFIVEINGVESRFDLDAMLDIASTPIVLRKNSSDPEFQTLPLFQFGEVSAVCLEAGIVEPITFSLLQFFLRREECVDDWLETAIGRNSYPLLHRIWTALEHAQMMVGGDTGKWAAKTVSDKIHPAISTYFERNPNRTL